MLQEFVRASPRVWVPWTPVQVMRSPSRTVSPSQVKVSSKIPGTCSRAAAVVSTLKMEPGV